MAAAGDTAAGGAEGREAVLAYLRAVDRAFGPGRLPGGWPTAEALVLARGLEFRAKPRPRGVPAGAPRACFRNAIAAARASRGALAYCEGWAWAGSLVPVHHAWVADPADGRAIEVTWPPGWEAERGPFLYVGLAFAAGWAAAALRRSGSVLDGPRRGHPLLSGSAPEAEWAHPGLPPLPEPQPGARGPGDAPAANSPTLSASAPESSLVPRPASEA